MGRLAECEAAQRALSTRRASLTAGSPRPNVTCLTRGREGLLSCNVHSEQVCLPACQPSQSAGHTPKPAPMPAPPAQPAAGAAANSWLRGGGGRPLPRRAQMGSKIEPSQNKQQPCAGPTPPAQPPTWAAAASSRQCGAHVALAALAAAASASAAAVAAWPSGLLYQRYQRLS